MYSLEDAKKGASGCTCPEAYLAVTLADELGWLSGVSGLELTSGHDNGGDAQLLKGQVALEGLSLSLATPDT